MVKNNSSFFSSCCPLLTYHYLFWWNHLPSFELPYGETHMSRNWERPSSNCRKWTWTLSLATAGKLNSANNHVSKLGIRPFPTHPSPALKEISLFPRYTLTESQRIQLCNLSCRPTETKRYQIFVVLSHYILEQFFFKKTARGN